MPGSRAFSFSDPHLYQSTIRAAEADVLPTAKGDFQGELTQIDLDKLWLQHGTERLPRILHAAMSTERAPITFTGGDNACAIHQNGKELSPDEIVFNAPGTDLDHRSSGPCDWRSMSLRPDDLAEAVRILANRDLAAHSGMRVLKPSASLLARLRALHEGAMLMAKNAPDVLSSPEVSRSLEHDLVLTMVQCLTESDPVATSASHHRHAAIMVRFNDFLDANSDKPLYLSDICKATGVSERMMRNCCQSYFGMGPMRYLWLRRMHLTHRALLTATPEIATVTRIATDHGFWELGRFAREFRKLFGDAPSAVLRKPATTLAAS